MKMTSYLLSQFRMRACIPMALCLVAYGLNANSGHAATISTSAPSDSPGPAVSNVDLLQTSLAPGEGTVGNTDLAGGTITTDPKTGQGIYASWLGNDTNSGSALTNGGANSLAGHVTATGLSNAAQLSDGVWGNEPSTSRGTAIFQNDEYIEYTFDLTSAPLGFDITGIDLFSNWGTGDGRNAIKVDIDYSLVATPGVFDQDLIEPTPFNPPAGTTQAIMNISDLTVTGVAGLRFNFPAQENGGVGYSEIDVFGAATVPEPCSALILGFGVVMLSTRRRLA